MTGPAATAVAAAAAALPPAALGEWLAGRRWAGARGATVAVTRLTAVPLFDAPASAALLVDATVGERPVRYLVPVVAAPSGAATTGTR